MHHFGFYGDYGLVSSLVIVTRVRIQATVLVMWLHLASIHAIIID